MYKKIIGYMKRIYVNAYRNICIKQILDTDSRPNLIRNRIKVAVHIFNRKLVLKEVLDLRNVAEQKTIFYEVKETNIGHRTNRLEPIAAEVSLPSLGYYEIDNVIINSGSPILFLVNSDCLARQLYPYPDQLNIRYTSGNCYGRRSTLHLIDITTKTVIDKGIMMTGSYATNWYHWINDILSRAVLWQKLPSELKDYPIIVPQKCLQSKNHYDILKLAFNQCEFVGIDDNALIKNCVYIDSPSLGTPHSYKQISDIDKIKSGHRRHELLKVYRDIVLSNLNISLNYDINSEDKKKVFLARKQNKRSYNQDEIQRELSKLGYVSLYLEDLSVEEQIIEINKAEFIVGPTGAAWANLLFSEAKGGLIWVPSCISDSTTYTKIAQATNTNLIYTSFPTKAKRWSDFMKLKEPYYLDPVKLIQEVKFMEKTSDLPNFESNKQ